jgi:uncharacterized membrane-anchored protein
MMRFASVLIVAVLVGLGVAWLADHNQPLTLLVPNYEIRTTTEVAGALLLVCFAILWLVLRLVFAFFTSFARTARWLSTERKAAPKLSVPDQPSTP